MKYAYISLCLLLAACATTSPVKTTFEQVATPVPFCPAPPTFVIPKNGGLSTITSDSKPGDVAKAYEYEVAYLAALTSIQQSIIDAYKQHAVDMDQLKQQINTSIDQLNAKINAPAK